MAVASNPYGYSPRQMGFPGLGDEFNQQEQMSCTELCTLAYLSRHGRHGRGGGSTQRFHHALLHQDLIWGYNHDGNRWDFHENQWTSVVIAML